jgi:hypothetical protein
MTIKQIDLRNKMGLQYTFLTENIDFSNDNSDEIGIKSIEDILDFSHLTTSKKPKDTNSENQLKIQKNENTNIKHYHMTKSFLKKLKKEIGLHYDKSIESNKLDEIQYIYNCFMSGYTNHLKSEDTTNKQNSPELLEKLAIESIELSLSSNWNGYKEMISEKEEKEKFNIQPGNNFSINKDQSSVNQWDGYHNMIIKKKKIEEKVIPKITKKDTPKYIDVEKRKNVVMVCSHEKHYNVKNNLEKISNFSIVETPKKLYGNIDLLIIYTDNMNFKIKSVFNKLVENPDKHVTINSTIIYSENKQKESPRYITCNTKHGGEGLAKKVMKVLYNK